MNQYGQLTRRDFDNLPKDLHWEVVGTHPDGECTINHLEAKTDKGFYFGGCFANDGSGDQPDLELDVYFKENRTT